MIAPLGGPYADLARVKSKMQIPDSDITRDEEISDSILSASDAINRWCGRQFGKTDTATERVYESSMSGVDVDDFWTLDGLLIAGAAYDPTAYAYEPLPRDGIRDGVPGWPYERLGHPFAQHPIMWAAYGFGRTAVTARWGWDAVPAGVQQACLMLTADDFKSGDAPFGVAGFGDYVVRIRANPKVQEKLAPYQRDPAKVAT